MYFAPSVLPILATSRLTVSPRTSSPMSPSLSTAESKSQLVTGETIHIEFLLTDISGKSVSSWNEPTEETSFLEVYFILLNDSQLPLMPANMAPSARLAKLLDPAGALYSAPRISVPLAEILEKKTFTATTIAPGPRGYVHELRHEIEISVRSRRKSSGLHLIGFIQMNMEGYMQNKGLPSGPHSIALGGAMIYDKVLEHSGGNSPVPPSHKETLYVSDPSYPDRAGESYSGPSHYHNTPGPTGYIGWMAGTRSSMGPKLKVRKSKNQKVILGPSAHLDESIDLSFASKTGRPLSTTGQGLDDFIGSVIDNKSLLSKAREVRQRTRTRLAENLSDNLGVMSYGSQETCSIYVDRKNIEKSHHSTIFGINFLNLLVKNSLFGDILSFHATMGNLEFVNRALLYSEIVSLKVNRSRLTDRPTAFNRAGTPSYGKFEFGEVEKLLVYAADAPTQRGINKPANSESIKNRLAKSESSLAALEEIEILKMSTAGVPQPTANHFRQFMIRDSDLFHNVEHGKYTYSLSVSVRDGVRWVIKEILENLKSSIDKYRAYTTLASLPAIENYQTGELTGNYNYETNQFTSNFTSRTDLLDVIRAALSSFAEVVRLISGTVINEEVMVSIENSLSPTTGNLPSIDEFLNTLNSLYGIVESTLDLGRSPSYGSEVYHNKQTYVPSGASGFSDILEESFETNIIVEAFNKSHLMADYSFPQVMPTPSLIGMLRERSIGSPTVTSPTVNSLGSYAPQSFIAVSPSPFESNSIEIKSTTRKSQDPQARRRTLSRAKGGLIEVSNHSEFSRSSATARQLASNKVGLLRADTAPDEGLVNKGEIHLMQSLPKLGGSITMGLSAYGTNFSTPSDLFDLEEFSTDEADGLPADIKSAISAAIYKGDDRDLILNSIKDNYKDLSRTKDQLGDVFDKMYNIFAMTKELKLANTTDSNHKQKLLGARSSLTGDNSKPSTDPYEQDRGLPKIVGPDQEKIDLKLEKLLKATKLSTRTAKKFLVVSIDRENKDKIMPVNNTFLLEV